MQKAQLCFDIPALCVSTRSRIWIRQKQKKVWILTNLDQAKFMDLNPAETDPDPYLSGAKLKEHDFFLMNMKTF